MAVFGSFIKDAAGILLLGALGGILFTLLQEKGIVMPSKIYQNDKLVMIKLGFIADMVVGGIAAALVYSLNPPSIPTTFVLIGIFSGIGGSAVLTSYLRGRESEEERRKKALLAERYRAAVARHTGSVMSQGNTSLMNIELMEIDEQLMN